MPLVRPDVQLVLRLLVDPLDAFRVDVAVSVAGFDWVDASGGGLGAGFSGGTVMGVVSFLVSSGGADGGSGFLGAMKTPCSLI